MVQASESTGLFQRLGKPLLRSEKLLRLPIRLESANGIVIAHGRDDHVALANVGISTRAPHGHSLRWLAPHDSRSVRLGTRRRLHNVPRVTAGVSDVALLPDALEREQRSTRLAAKDFSALSTALGARRDRPACWRPRLYCLFMRRGSRSPTDSERRRSSSSRRPATSFRAPRRGPRSRACRWRACWFRRRG